MSEPAQMQQIFEEIKELRLLYKRLLDRLVPMQEPTAEEKNAIEEKDNDLADEKELLRALGVHD